MKHVPLASAALIGLIAGVLLAQIPYIKIQNTLDLDGLISLLVGLVLFFGLNLIYQQQSTVLRGEKDILLKLTEDGLNASERLDSIFSKHYREDPLSSPALEEIFAGLQRYNNAVHSIEVAIRESKLGPQLDLEPIKQHGEAYRAVLTDTPFPNRYDAGTYRDQQRHQLAVREAFVSFTLKLNRL